MHELAIAESLLATAEEERRTRALGPIKKIGVRIGALAGVQIEALLFCFEALGAHQASPVELDIEAVPVTGTCLQCSSPFEVEELLFRCPKCGSGRVETRTGMELHISYLETRDPDYHHV